MRRRTAGSFRLRLGKVPHVALAGNSTVVTAWRPGVEGLRYKESAARSPAVDFMSRLDDGLVLLSDPPFTALEQLAFTLSPFGQTCSVAQRTKTRVIDASEPSTPGCQVPGRARPESGDFWQSQSVDNRMVLI